MVGKNGINYSDTVANPSSGGPYLLWPGIYYQNSKTKIGVTLGDLSDELAQRFGIDKGVKGAIVREVDPKSAAAREGIRPGDVITEIAKTEVSNAKEAREALAKADLSKGVRLYVVSREGSRFVFLQSEK